MSSLRSNTAADLEPESDAIWKFQRYELVMDFAMRRCLPPPLNAVAYAWLAIAFVMRVPLKMIKRTKRRVGGAAVHTGRPPRPRRPRDQGNTSQTMLNVEKTSRMGLTNVSLRQSRESYFLASTEEHSFGL